MLGEHVPKKTFGNAVPVEGVGHVLNAANPTRRGDADLELVHRKPRDIDLAATLVIFHVLAVGPYACRLFVLEPEPAIVEAVRLEILHARKIFHGGCPRVLDVPLFRLEVVDDFQNAFDVFAVVLTDFIEGCPGFVCAVRADVGGL